MNNVVGYWFESMRYMADIQQVVTLRMIKFAQGGPWPFHEASRMATEKASAFNEAQVAGAVAIARRQPPGEIAKRVTKPYRARVRANVKRLRKSSRHGK
jgi:hypothetical protein